VTPNNSFKPNALRYTKHMADKACHVFGSTTHVGLTQVLAAIGESVAMEAHHIIGIAAIYAFAYYAIARSALGDIRRFDSELHRHLGAVTGVSSKNSAAIIEMLFDRRLPQEHHPRGFRTKLFLARAMLLLSPVLLIVVFVLL